MTATPQAISLLRRKYTGESVQQSRQAIDVLGPGAPPIPPAATPQQIILESRALLSLLEYRNVFTRYPLGIAAVRPEPDCVSLRVESEERAAEILFNLLPSYVSDEEVYGVPGLRITHRARAAIELQVLGQPARLRLTGLPARSWRKAIEQMLEQWTDPEDALLCWETSPRAWTSAEIQHRTRWNNPDDPFTQEQRHGDWLVSGLLRRAALLHTVTNTYFLDGYRTEMTRLVLRTSHTPDRGPGPHHLIAALVDPPSGSPTDCSGSAATPTKDWASTSSSSWATRPVRLSSTFGPQWNGPPPACRRSSGTPSSAVFPPQQMRGPCLRTPLPCSEELVFPSVSQPREVRANPLAAIAPRNRRKHCEGVTNTGPVQAVSPSHVCPDARLVYRTARALGTG